MRSSAVLIVRDDRLLVIERGDGLGLSLPGGVQRPWETTERCAGREMSEETGLQATELQAAFRWRRRSVFVARASGTLRESAEGKPYWVRCDELDAHYPEDFMESLRRMACPRCAKGPQPCERSPQAKPEKIPDQS